MTGMVDFLARGMEAHGGNKLLDAARNYRAHLVQYPDAGSAWLAQGMLYQMKVSDPASAFTYYRRASASLPGDPIVRLHLGSALAEMDRPSEAIEPLRDAVAGVGDKFAYSELACAYMRLGRLTDAQAVADRYRREQPDHYFAHYLAAWIAAARGNLNEGLRYVSDALLFDYFWPMPYGLRSFLLWQSGRLEESRLSLQEMVFVNSDRIASQWESERRLETGRLWRRIRDEAKKALDVTDIEPVNFLFMTGGMGDQYLIASLLSAFKRHNPSRRVVVFSDSKAKWATLFPAGADLFLHLPADDIHSLLGISRFFPDHPYIPWFPWMGPMVSLASSRQWARCLLGLPEGVPWAKPVIPPDVLRRSEELFHRLGGIPGRSVLVAPISNSNPGASDLWWTQLVAALRAAGFVVFQNVANMLNPTLGTLLDGAIPVEMPLEEALPFCELAGHFIGVRSGLCDLLGTARLKKKAVHVRKRYPRNENYPMAVWNDYESGFSMRRAFESDLWTDIDLAPHGEFDPRLIEDWVS